MTLGIKPVLSIGLLVDIAAQDKFSVKVTNGLYEARGPQVIRQKCGGADDTTRQEDHR